MTDIPEKTFKWQINTPVFIHIQCCDKVWNQVQQKKNNIYEILQVSAIPQNASDVKFFVDDLLPVRILTYYLHKFVLNLKNSTERKISKYATAFYVKITIISCFRFFLISYRAWEIIPSPKMNILVFALYDRNKASKVSILWWTWKPWGTKWGYRTPTCWQHMWSEDFSIQNLQSI